ncbi:hypothetical protein XcodCFBP4690_21405 [Xanthomonas codiaei]|uniref:Uncharacterized protein n=1 Tax=Xanthomonas codiaei TaxID=56463 RepID=A0A2S7C5K5_9XANT|nr:hypothetical protein XcodCFBP4690_21405 [Xanthomonas codiaei]
MDMQLFRTLSKVCEQTKQWLADNNQQIPQEGSGGLTPAEFGTQY